MSSYSDDRLLARPLRHDRLFQLWVLALLALALWSLPTYVEWGGAPNPARALGLLGLLLRVGFWLWLLLLIAPAFVRRGVRRRRSRPHRRGGWRPVWQGLALGWRGAGLWSPRPLPTTSSRSSAARSAAAPSAAVGLHGSGAWPTGGPPTFRSVGVQPRAVVAGRPVTVQWDAPLAEHVAVGELTGLPPSGSAEVVPRAAGPLTLTAVNAYGTGSWTTEPLTITAAPPIDLSAVPVPPAVPRTTAAPAAPAVRRLRLDDVIDRQNARRATAPRRLAPGTALPAAPSIPGLSTAPASRRLR